MKWTRLRYLIEMNLFRVLNFDTSKVHTDAISNWTWNLNLEKIPKIRNFSRQSDFQNIIINEKVFLSNKNFQKINRFSSKFYWFSPFWSRFSVMMIRSIFRVGFENGIGRLLKNLNSKWLLIWKLEISWYIWNVEKAYVDFSNQVLNLRIYIFYDAVCSLR